MKRKTAFFLLIIFLLFISLCFYKYYRWKYLWSLDEPIESYRVKHHFDDTVRVVMIGDSWAEMHNRSIGDVVFQNKLESALKCPVLFHSSGMGGAKTKEIYQLLFSTTDNGTMSLLQGGADYCILLAGINDSAANLGTTQFCHYYRQILNLLLRNGICPIVVELPNVRIWDLYINKPLKDITVDYLRSWMTNSPMYDFSDYRVALNNMLNDENLVDSVVFIEMSGWNKNSPEIDEELFIDDRIHLNNRGYELMDSCIISALARNLR